MEIGVGVRAGTWIALNVSDSGIGIEPEDLPRISDGFYQADSFRSVAGAGLGLSLARRIADTHEAAIEAASQVEFTFSLHEVSVGFWAQPGLSTS